MRPMSLSQYRSTIKIMGEKSALFEYKKDIFEAVEMGLSHAQIHSFLTSQKGLKISARAVSKWIKTHSKPKAQNFEPKKKANTTVIQQNEVVNQPKVEPTEAPIQFDNLSNDPKYAKMWQVAQERTKMRQEALKEKYNENNDG